jgi:hypothetical protein
MSEGNKVLFSTEITLECKCENDMCVHMQAALNKAIQDAWQSGRKAGIATVIGKMKEAAENGLVLRLQDGELELPTSFSDLEEPAN